MTPSRQAFWFSLVFFASATANAQNPQQQPQQRNVAPHGAADGARPGLVARIMGRPGNAPNADGARITARIAAAARAKRPAVQAPQAPRTPDEAKAHLVTTAQHNNMPSFTDGNGKIVINASTHPQWEAIRDISAPGSGILQILTDRAGNVHPVAVYDGELLHFQYHRDSSPKNWRLQPWTQEWNGADGKTFKLPGAPARATTAAPLDRTYGALIQLTPQEDQKLRETIAQFKHEQGPTFSPTGQYMPGEKWANGHIQAVKDRSNFPTFNCSSGWCQIKVGENGQNIAQTAGITVSGSGNHLISSLARRGNERVVGAVVYGPQTEDFGTRPDQAHVQTH